MKSFINILNENEFLDMFETKDEFGEYLKEKYKIPNITFSKHYNSKKLEYFIKIHFFLKQNISTTPNFTLQLPNLLYRTQVIKRLKYLDKNIKRLLIEHV